ncbi:MAG: nucleotidyltransferase family protein [Segetibacter sp.]
MTGLVILAAGPSTRLGEPKQKIIFEGKSLLQRAVQTALDSACRPVIVLLGAYDNEIQSDIENEDVIVYHNFQWEEGMSSSIRLGIAMLQKTQTPVSDVILTVCDQPFADTTLLNDMINKKAITSKGIIACSYKNTLGVPVLFDKKFFPELLSLEGPDGAKKLIMKHKEAVADIPFDLGSFDIDTNDDYEALIGFK